MTQSRPTSADSEDPRSWDLLDTPEAHAEARAAAEDYRRRMTPPLGPDYLNVLGRARLDAGSIRRFARERERIVPLLRQMAGQHDATAAAACVALVSLGDESYAARLVQILSDDDSQSLADSLNQLAISAELIKATPGLKPIAVPIRRIAGTPGHQARFAALRAAFELDALPDDHEGIVDELVRGMSAAKYPDPWIPKTLAAVARRGGAEALSAARVLLRPPLLEASNVLRAARAGDAIVPELQALLSSPSKKEIYGAALEALATLKVDVRQELLRALDDPQLLHRAAPALRIACEGTGDEDAIAALSLAAINATYKGATTYPAGVNPRTASFCTRHTTALFRATSFAT